MRVFLDTNVLLEYPDFEDSMQYQCALNNNCDAIITFNQKGFKNVDRLSIQVLSPEEFVEAIS